ncbi:hypothetical protein psal_cds_301 [Pandoravirus salinus]|uniref:Uncharacterized protein n=1 Tax=Pandoravirus salinus TaxID=1349410 RepID=S4VU78_9VIRU|nr:hypothetical protein psal_cds_301 [Pandoravirus salinus]AGO83903.2 hypothetical protein psal_cds_301 [Pandoravirus salinus]
METTDANNGNNASSNSTSALLATGVGAQERARPNKRPIDEIDQVIDCVINQGSDAHSDYESDVASDSGRSLTSAPRSKRARGDILAPDGSVLRAGGSDVDDDPAYRAQLLQLVASATNSRTTDLETGVGDLIDFYLVIGQPAVFREMIGSVSTLLDDRLPLLIDNRGAFCGVRISGMEKSQTCYVRAQFSCDTAYVSAGAISAYGGLENCVKDAAGAVVSVERMTRFHVHTKVMKACLDAIPKTMSLRVVKSARRDEIVFGCYDGPSSKRQDMACVPTVIAETSDVSAEAEGVADDDDPTRWIVEMDCDHDALFSFSAESLRNAIAPAVALSADEVTFTVKEPREQLRGGRPAPVRHAVLVVSVKGTGSYSKPFYATGPWDDAQQEVGASTPSGAQPSLAGSAASTPRSYTVGADADASMSTELEGTLEQRYANVYDVKKMMGFLKGIRGTVYVTLGEDMPISIAHGNTQYRVEMVQAPKNPDAAAAAASTNTAA